MNTELNNTCHQRIVIITSDFLPSPDANGVCVLEIAKELKNKYTEIIVISDLNTKDKYEVIDGIKIMRIPSTFYRRLVRKTNESNIKFYFLLRKLFGLFSIIKSLLLLPIFPNISPIRTNKIYKTLININKEKNIDKIVSVYRPYESIAAGLRFKRSSSNTKLLLYFLDVIEEDNRPSFIPKKIYGRILHRTKKKEINLSDKILLPLSIKNKNMYNKDYSSKIYYIDFPLFIPMIPKEKKFFNNKIVLTYIGNIDKNNRNPKYLLELLSAINCELPLEVNFYGGLGSFKDEFKQLEKKYNFIKYFGYITPTSVNNILTSSNILINVSNKMYPNMVPSKIFQYFSTGKPIINLVNNEKDASVIYFEKYKLTLLINDKIQYDNEQFNNDVIKLESFIKYNANKVLDSKLLENVYEMNLPSYTASIIRET